VPYKDRQHRRDWDAAKWRERRSEWLAGKVCVECGGAENLELDHIDPATKVGHKIWSWSAERRAAEIAKCQPLCRDCHRAKSMAERTVHHEHGTTGFYHRGCRCDDCRAANTAYRRDRRANGAT